MNITLLAQKFCNEGALQIKMGKYLFSWFYSNKGVGLSKGNCDFPSLLKFIKIFAIKTSPSVHTIKINNYKY